MKYILFSCLAVTSFCAYGQYYHKRNNSDSSSKSYQPKQITLVLHPVVIENGKYYFDGRPITYDGLMLPMISLNDEKTNQRMRTVRTLINLRRPIKYLGFAYVTLAGLNAVHTQQGQEAYIYTTISIFVLYQLYDLSITMAKGSAINRYNEVVLQPSASISPNMGLSLGCTIRF
jgi:hypothetical protein